MSDLGIDGFIGRPGGRHLPPLEDHSLEVTRSNRLTSGNGPVRVLMQNGRKCDKLIQPPTREFNWLEEQRRVSGFQPGNPHGKKGGRR